MLKFWSMGLDDAEEFFDRCAKKEAITREERQAILEEMMAERSNITSGEFENTEIEEQLNQKKIIGIRYGYGGDDSVTIRGN